MKKILSFLIFLTFGAFTLCALYVFNLPPFHINPNQDTQNTQPAATNDQPIANGVVRSKNFNEYFQRAELLETNNFPTLAISEFQNAYSLDQRNTLPLFKIGKIHLKTSDFTKAQATFEAILKIDANNTEAKVLLGKAWLGKRTIQDDSNIKEAQKIFDSITAPNQESKFYQGIIAAYYKDYETSKKFLNEALALNTNANITKKATNFMKAFAEFNATTEGQSVHIKTLLARSFNQSEEYEMAIPLLYEVVKEKNDYRDAWILLGYAYLKIDKVQDAIDALERAKKLDPNNANTLFYLGLSYYSVNDYQQAANNLEKAKFGGFEPKIQVDQKLAEVYLQLQNYKKSAQSYEEVLAHNNEDINYYVRPIWIYIEKLNQPQNALQLAKKAAEIHPKDAMSFNLIGWSYIASKKFDMAESNLKKAMVMNPDLDATYLNYGMLLEAKGEAKNALSFYKKANLKGKGNSISTIAATRYNQLIAQTTNLNTNIQANILSQ